MYYLFLEILIILLLFCLILSMIRIYKKKTNLKTIAKEYPTLNQKVRIINSKSEIRLNNKAILQIILIIVISLIFCISYPRLNITIDKNTIHIIGYCILILFLYLLFKIKSKQKQIENEIRINIRTKLINKYGQIYTEPVHSREIIIGDKTEEQNIRKTNMFSYKINKFNCTMTNYFYEILEKTYYNNSYHYAYKKTNNIIEYYYDLSNLGLTNINEEIIMEQKIAMIIDKIAKTRIMNISIKKNGLLIKKETVLYGYNDNDATIDINDIEIFYNELVKTILDGGKNEHF